MKVYKVRRDLVWNMKDYIKKKKKANQLSHDFNFSLTTISWESVLKHAHECGFQIRQLHFILLHSQISECPLSISLPICNWNNNITQYIELLGKKFMSLDHI